MDTTKPPAASPEAEALRKKILGDPNTAKIAENLGVPLEDYVNQVLHFALHPNEEPQLYVVEDAALRQMGYEPPDAEAMGQYIVEAATLAEASAPQTGFDEAKKPPVQLQSAQGSAAPQKDDAQLKADLDKRIAGRGQQG
jgi:hypothetical protein